MRASSSGVGGALAAWDGGGRAERRAAVERVVKRDRRVAWRAVGVDVWIGGGL